MIPLMFCQNFLRVVWLLLLNIRLSNNQLSTIIENKNWNATIISTAVVL